MTVHEPQAVVIKGRSPGGRRLLTRCGSFLLITPLVLTVAAGCFPSVSNAQATSKNSSLVAPGSRPGLAVAGPYTGQFSGTLNDPGNGVLTFHGTALFATPGPSRGWWWFTSGSLSWKASGHPQGCTESGSGTVPLNSGNAAGSITVNDYVGHALNVEGTATVPVGEYFAWLSPNENGPSMPEKLTCSGEPTNIVYSGDMWQFFLYAGPQKAADFRVLSGARKFGISYSLKDEWSFHET